ncbi:MAG: hypothetical protein U0163_01505, partial [Gemmatimonadaceae bacterium]
GRMNASTFTDDGISWDSVAAGRRNTRHNPTMSTDVRRRTRSADGRACVRRTAGGGAVIPGEFTTMDGR